MPSTRCEVTRDRLSTQQCRVLLKHGWAGALIIISVNHPIPTSALIWPRGKAVQRDDIGHPLGEISAPENRVGPKTYSKGRPPDMIGRLLVSRSMSLACGNFCGCSPIQLMTLPSPVAHQHANHKDNPGMFVMFA